MTIRTSLPAAALLLGIFVGSSAFSQTQNSGSTHPPGIAYGADAQDKPNPNIATQPITAVAVGQETFRTYCASCHGLDAKGTGPVVAVLRYKPSDLTQLSKRNGGKFPSAVIEGALDDNRLIPAHGSREMPIWSDAFRNTNHDESMVKLKIHNVVLYIESIQEK